MCCSGGVALTCGSFSAVVAGSVVAVLSLAVRFLLWQYGGGGGRGGADDSVVLTGLCVLKGDGVRGCPGVRVRGRMVGIQRI